MNELPKESEEEKNQRIKQLMRVVCICKGISLGKFLPVLPSCSTVEEVNAKVGSGSGGCQGVRCSPRIKVLLSKMRHLEDTPQETDKKVKNGTKAEGVTGDDK